MRVSAIQVWIIALSVCLVGVSSSTATIKSEGSSPLKAISGSQPFGFETNATAQKKAVAFPQEAPKTPSGFAAIVGRVTNLRTGDPVAGARVSLASGNCLSEIDARCKEPFQNAFTNDRGLFRLERVTPGVYSLKTSKLGYLSAWFQGVRAEDGRGTEKDLALEPLARYSGRVLDDAGRPVRGAKVRLIFGSRHPSESRLRLLGDQGDAALTATTGSAGEFEIFAPSEEQNLRLVAVFRGYAPVRAGPLSVRSPQRNQLLLRLSRGLQAQGRIVDEDGSPIQGAVGLAYGPWLKEFGSESPDLIPQATSASNGSFVLTGLESGDYELKVSRTGRASRTVSGIQVKSNKTNRIPDIVLLPEAELGGRVIDTAGQPISNATITVSGEADPDEATSDEKGSFVIQGFSAGASVSLITTAAGHSDVSTAVTVPDKDVLIVLPRLGALRGRVEDAETLMPINDFQIRIGFGPNKKTFNSPDGNFEWEGLPPGRWSFEGSAPGYQVAELSEVEIRPGEATEPLLFSLNRGVRLTGRVVDATTGAGISGVAVNYHKASETKSAAWHFYSRVNALLTDSDGHFEFAGVPPEEVTVVANSPLYTEARQTVAAASDRFVELKLSKGGAVSGRVMSPDSITPVSAAQVSLLSVLDMSSVIIPTDEVGSFSFKGVAEGRYQLWAESNHGRTKVHDIVLGKNETLQNLVLLVKAGATIRGKITGLWPSERRTVEVVAQAAGDFVAATSMAPDGSYAIPGVPPGLVEVTAQTYSPRSIMRSIEVREGILELALNIEFPQSAKLSGRVTQAGQPVAHRRVSAFPRERGMVAASGKTDQAGMFAIEGLSEGDYLVRLDSNAPKPVRVSGDTRFDIELSPLSISGRVLDTNTRQPLAGVSLELQPLSSGGGAGNVRRVVSDSSGRFFVDDVEAGQFQIIAQKSGFEVAATTLVVPSSSEVLLSLTPADGIPIRVRDGISGQGLRAATVNTFSSALVVRLSVALDETGRGKLPQLPAGRYNLQVSAGEYAPRTVTGWAVPGSSLDLMLTPGGRLELHVDEAYRNARASLIDVNGGNAVEFGLSALTVIPQLVPGRYALQVTQSEQTKTYQVAISEGQTTILEVK